jgi:hypothetical protein
MTSTRKPIPHNREGAAFRQLIRDGWLHLQFAEVAHSVQGKLSFHIQRTDACSEFDVVPEFQAKWTAKDDRLE